jgi:hypothetical protein
VAWRDGAGWVWDRIACRWVRRTMTYAAWSALPAAIVVGLCVGGPLLLRQRSTDSSVPESSSRDRQHTPTLCCLPHDSVTTVPGPDLRSRLSPEYINLLLTDLMDTPFLRGRSPLETDGPVDQVPDPGSSTLALGLLVLSLLIRRSA